MDYIEKNKTRAQTRYNLEKKKRHCNNFYWMEYQDEDDIKRIKRVGKLAHNPKSCSCWMCGNPRKIYKGRIKSRITLKEEKIMQSFSIIKYLKYEYK